MSAARDERLAMSALCSRLRPGLAFAAGLLLLCPGAPLGQPATPAGQASAAQQTPPDKEQLERRLLSVGMLIEKSSAARQIEASGDARALERRAKARDAYRQALQARDAGDYATAARLAAASSTLMFEAARLAGRDRGSEDRRRTDFAARLESVQSLLAAQQRISAEKPGTPDAAETTRGIEKLIGEARQHAAANDLQQAESVLDRAYLLAKAAVSSMRAGDTLVRSLNFATPEEEYRYELDRNDTHMMLVKLLTADKPRMAGMDAMLNGFVAKAVGLRGEAERTAASGDHAAAIEQLERSTRELVRAIRGLGIFIPG
ncbi:MAG: hypothetical protein OEO84_05570 [Betaproteobacteria bacterium]|nr:hypothetical protein [Betaproteobacteria bacterium]